MPKRRPDQRAPPGPDTNSSADQQSDSKAPNMASNTLAAEPESQLSFDRSVFGSSQFSPPTFVNSITNRVLFPVSMPNAWRSTDAMGSRHLTQGSEEFSTAAKSGEQVDQSRRSWTSDSGDRVAMASSITTNIVAALREIEKIQEAGEQSLKLHEARCRILEIREKRKLATIRLGLEGTTARLHEYESRVCNAVAATAGIEQHLAQSNARVLRGKVVSVLLQRFRMLITIQKNDLTTALMGLKKARAEQRAKTTQQWKTSDVLPTESMYFEWDVDLNGKTNSPNGANNCDDKRLKGSPLRNAGEGDSQIDSRRRQSSANPRLHTPVSSQRQMRVRGCAAAGKLVGNDAAGGVKEELHHLEAAAVAAGLDRSFVTRGCTEAQVDLCQRLLHLRVELDGIVKNIGNIDVYVSWLREELMNDVLHLVECFNSLYAEHSEGAAYQPYGRLLLRTMEFVSRLYTVITTSQDALLSSFYSHTVGQMCSTLFNEHSMVPPSMSPALERGKKGSSGDAANIASDDTGPGSSTAMNYYRTSMEPDLRRTLDFIISRARRDVIIVEAISGTTNTARQQLLTQITKGVVEPFFMQQIKLAEAHEKEMRNAEARLSPRSKRCAMSQVIDAITYKHTVQAQLFGLFQAYVQEIRNTFSHGEADFLDKYADSLFGASRASYAEVELLDRHCALLEDTYAPKLRYVNGEVFDLRSEHMHMAKELVQRVVELLDRTQIYARPDTVKNQIIELVQAAAEHLGKILDAELRKAIEFMRNDRDNWRSKPKQESGVLTNIETEAQQCGMRLLFFAQSSMVSLSDAIEGSCGHLLEQDLKMASTIEKKKALAFAPLEGRAELLLNHCAQAIVVRSLSLLQHFQHRNDYTPKVAKGADAEVIAPPCTRACTLFCKYIAQQFERAKEFINAPSGGIPHRTGSFQAPSSDQGTASNQLISSNTSPRSRQLWSENHCIHGGAPGNSSSGSIGAFLSAAAASDLLEADRSRARKMGMQQLLFGDGAPSPFVRTIGVCLYRGISVHLKNYPVSDRGALVYKQDVTAYVEAMQPLARSAGLGGAVVDVLFRLLKETASLMIMPPDHLKGVWNTGLLRLLSNEEKVQIIKMRVDLHDNFRDVVK